MKKNTAYSLLFISTMLIVSLCVYTCGNTSSSVDKPTLLDSIENIEVFNTLLTDDTTLDKPTERTLFADEIDYVYDTTINSYIYYTENVDLAKAIFKYLDDRKESYTIHIVNDTKVIITNAYIKVLFH